MAAALERQQRRKPGVSDAADAARVASLFGYTAEDNPFGDVNLTQQFVWRKKLERDITAGRVSAAPTRDDVARQREELAEELTRAKERRVKREAERAEMERLRAEEDRLRDAEAHAGWEAKEEDFHRRQAATRSLVRIREGREKPVDALARNLVLTRACAGDGDAEARGDAVEKGLELREPLDVVGALDLESLLVLAAGVARGTSLAALQDVEDDVDAMFAGKALPELLSMDASVHAVLESAAAARSGGGGGGAETVTVGAARGGAVDYEYWAGVRSHLNVAIAKARLGAAHDALLAARIVQLEERGGIVARGAGAGELSRIGGTGGGVGGAARAALEARVTTLRARGLVAEEEQPRAVGDEGGAGVLDASADFAAAIVDASGGVLPSGLDSAELPADAEVAVGGGAARGGGEGAGGAGDKYRPRKPRYFNRVRTGYDWNRYNKMHYDRDNPPPKTVQGYQFNVFYPDLLDRTRTPTFALEPADSDAYCLIRFSGGPPYEDIAFKIVNKEWEVSRKRGFKSSFDRGVLQLHVNFKRPWYRA